MWLFATKYPKIEQITFQTIFAKGTPQLYAFLWFLTNVTCTAYIFSPNLGLAS